jgi:hypothetical protein
MLNAISLSKTFMTLWQEHEKLVSVLEPRIL